LQLTAEYVGKDLTSKDVFICATVDQGGNVVNACKALGLDTVKCRGHRVNTATMWALGLAGAASKCKNPDSKKLVGKGAALVGVSPCCKGAGCGRGGFGGNSLEWAVDVV